VRQGRSPEIQKFLEAVPAQTQLTRFWVASLHGRADSSFALRPSSLVTEIQAMPVNSGENRLASGLGGSQVANYCRETGLDSIAANPPGLPHIPAPRPLSPARLYLDTLGLWSRCQAPGTHHIFGQSHGVILGDCLGSPGPVRTWFPRVYGSPYLHSGGWFQDSLSAPKCLLEEASTYKQMALLVETRILFINVSQYI